MWRMLGITTLINSLAVIVVSAQVTSVTVTGVTGSDTIATTTFVQGQTTAITECHSSETAVYCINGEGSGVQVEVTQTEEPSVTYTSCHAHGTEMYCVDSGGNEVAVIAVETHEEPAISGGSNCHFHAGVEHCTGDNNHESSTAQEEGDCHVHAGVEHCDNHRETAAEVVDCSLRDRDFDIGLRIGTLFVMLVTSAIGVLAPTLLSELPLGYMGSNILMVTKQFGTGIIISTAFIHLYTHAELMFQNICIGRLAFEGTTSSIVMAGILLSFLVEYAGLRFVASQQVGRAGNEPIASESQQAPEGGNPFRKKSIETQNAFAAVSHHHHGGSNTKLSVLVMEAGILFHSILIGLTLVVAGDHFYRTLLVVIVFHQFFEGLALGARIASLAGPIFPGKFVMCVAFALITPAGMAIGLGVLNSFNGNDPSTVIAIGVLDALSAGILIWVGVVDMWAHDWVMEGGELFSSGLFKTIGAGFALILGMVIMGLLGKWA